jgi:hypothetical protein
VIGQKELDTGVVKLKDIKSRSEKVSKVCLVKHVSRSQVWRDEHWRYLFQEVKIDALIDTIRADIAESAADEI